MAPIGWKLPRAQFNWLMPMETNLTCKGRLPSLSDGVELQSINHVATAHIPKLASTPQRRRCARKSPPHRPRRTLRFRGLASGPKTWSHVQQHDLYECGGGLVFNLPV